MSLQWWMLPILLEVIGIVLGIYIANRDYKGDSHGSFALAAYTAHEIFTKSAGILVWAIFTLCAICAVIGHFI